MTNYQVKWDLTANDAGASAAFARVEKHLETMIAKMDAFGRKTDQASRKQQDLARAALLNAKAEEQALKNVRYATNSARNAKINDANLDTRVAANKKKINEASNIAIKKGNDLAKVSIDTNKKLGDARVAKISDLSAANIKIKEGEAAEKSLHNTKKNALIQENQLIKNQTTLSKQKVQIGKQDTQTLLNNNKIIKSNLSLDNYKRNSGRQGVGNQLGDATTIGAAVGAPSVLGAIYALKNFAEDQNRRIGLKTEFGGDAEKIYKGLKEYAIKTSFSMDEAVVLARRVGMTEGLGIDTPQAKLKAVESIGSVLIASAIKSQDMENATRQISQMIGRQGNVNVRQDVDPLVAAGLPIDKIITKFLRSGGDKTMSFRKKFEAGGVNNKLVFDALMWYSKTQEVITANIEKQGALMNTWKSTIESLEFASVGVGKALDENLKITDRLKDVGDAFNFIDKSLQGDESQSKINRQVAALATTMVIGTSSAFLFQAILKRLAIAFGANAANIGKMGFAFKELIPFVAGAYAIFGDWKGLAKDINEDGYLVAFAKHIDLITASVIALTFAFKKNLPFMAAYGTYETLKYVNSEGFTGAGGGADKTLDWLGKSSNYLAGKLGMEAIDYGQTDYARIKRNQENQAKNQTDAAVNLNQQIIINALKNGQYDVQTKTSKAKSKPADNLYEVEF